MDKTYVRVKKDGFIYEYDPILARNPECEVITAEEAYPEQHIPNKQKGRKTTLVLDTADVAEAEAPLGNVALNLEVTKRTQ